MKRIFLFILMNLLVLTLLSVVTHVVLAFFGLTVDQAFGGDWGACLVFAAIYGFAGSIISLLLSKTMAKASVGARTITGSEGESERWLVATVEDLARRANLKTPEVAIYHGSANAFATGAFRNSALVAVSDEIMGQMSKEELRAVLGHEMSHVANGDMVTMSLLQGVLNTFVIFGARLLAQVVVGLMSNREGRHSSRSNMGLYYLVYQVMQLLLGLLASLVAMGYSRRREYAADAGSANLLGSPSPMIAALRRLGNLKPGVLPDSLKAFGISSAKPRKTSLLATHPALEDRIEALERLMRGR